MDIFLLYMCILHIHALFNVYPVGDKPLGFTELKTGFTMQPLFHSLGLIIFIRRPVVCMTCFSCCCRTQKPG